MAENVSCSFASQDLPCSTSGSGSALVPLSACTQDMTFHLTGLHLTSKRGRGKTGLSEKDLILNRAGLFDLNPAQTELMTICPKHRKNLTTDWQGRKSRVCCYPCHKGQRKQLEVHRRVNALMSAEIRQLFNTVVPIGSGKLLLIIIDVNLQ